MPGDGYEDEADSLHNYLVVKEDGATVDEDYPLAALAVPREGQDPVFVATVLVGVSTGGAIVAAFPGNIWHRTAARRVLPKEFVRKITAGRVQLTGPDERGVPLAGDCRVWFALLTEAGEAAVDFVRDLEDDVPLPHLWR